MVEYGDYIIFVDESGDHALESINQDYPIFVLVLVIIKKRDYIEKIVPAFINFKFKYWGHTQIILHENEIRKEKNQFGLLRTNPMLRAQFYEDLTTLIGDAPFEFVGAVIKKELLIKKYDSPYNPYEIALKFCLEECLTMLIKKQQRDKIIHLVVEGRGAKEDKELELEFRRICNNQRRWGYKDIDFSLIPFNMVCTDKKCNSTGLQLADLIARPIGLSILRPSQKNRAFEVIQAKGRSLKCFPQH
nr:DUF3800 domain-containing protein [Rickettsia endosymbiont of Ceutorhynchus assimilis]